MTIADLVAKLSHYPASARVTLLDPDKGWLLPIEITRLPTEGSARGYSSSPLRRTTRAMRSKA